MCIQISRICKASSINLPFKWLHFFMNCCFMYFGNSCKGSTTNVTLERLYSLMNCCHMYIRVSFSCQACITNVLLERLLSFMNRIHVSFQVGISCKNTKKYQKMQSFIIYTIFHFVHVNEVWIHYPISSRKQSMNPYSIFITITNYESLFHFENVREVWLHIRF